MAKFDTYTLHVQVGGTQDYARLELTVLFEDGDKEAEVMEEVRNLLYKEGIAMKNQKFLNAVRQ